jgi:hypothetical protein
VRVVLDDQGVLVIGASGVRAGRVEFTSLVPFDPGEFDLPLHGEHLPYRSEDSVEVDDLAFDLDLNGNLEDGFELGGEVRPGVGPLPAGLQDQGPRHQPARQRIDRASVLGGQAAAGGSGAGSQRAHGGRRLHRRNNIAPEIRVDILLHVGGTLSEPQLAGDVRPMDGRFNIPFMRGDFDLVPGVNHVTFIGTKSIATARRPTCTSRRPTWSPTRTATTTTSHDHQRSAARGAHRHDQRRRLDRNQVAMLLVTGRTASDSQRVSTQNATMGANAATMGDVGGQITRDAVDNLMQPYIDDTFYRLTGLNLRLTVGSDGFQGRVRKRISRRLNLQADYLQGFYGNSRWTAQGDVWLGDYLTLGGRLEQIRTSALQGVPETQP